MYFKTEIGMEVGTDVFYKSGKKYVFMQLICFSKKCL